MSQGGWRRGCIALVLVALLACGAGLLLVPRQDPADFVYPGAVANPNFPAQQVGLYGAYTTGDSLDQVAAWYAGRGLTSTRELLGSRPSVSGSRGTPVRLALPGTGRALRIGRAITYRAVALGPRTAVNLWCEPPCLPSDPPWSFLQLGP